MQYVSYCRALLQDLGCVLAGIAANTSQALKILQSKSPDIILCNTKLQHHPDSLEIIEAVRELSQLPVIYWSRGKIGLPLQRLKNTGPSNFMKYPINPQELSIAIDLALLNQNF